MNYYQKKIRRIAQINADEEDAGIVAPFRRGRVVRIKRKRKIANRRKCQSCGRKR